MINNIRKLNVFNYQEYHQMPPHNRVSDTDQAPYLRHQAITNATIMKMMFSEFPEDTEMLLGMGVSLSVETYGVDNTFRKRWEIIAHVTVEQKREWDEYKFMEKLAG
jgi:hypothetical protein